MQKQDVSSSIRPAKSDTAQKTLVKHRKPRCFTGDFFVFVHAVLGETALASLDKRRENRCFAARDEALRRRKAISMSRMEAVVHTAKTCAVLTGSRFIRLKVTFLP